MEALSVIIVNYNVEYFLEQCLYSVRRAAEEVSCQIIVVDNNSVDGSVAMVRDKFPEVLLIANKENTGFSRANNQGIKLATGRYVLLLNPDTLVEEDTFAKSVAFMDSHPDAGGLGVKMIDGKGRFLPESKRGLPTPSVAFYKIFGLSAIFPKSKIFGRYHLGYLDNDEVHEVDVLSGAFMLMRKSVLDTTGLLDEAFFMYGEDIDLSYRITQAGYKNYYFPDTRIIHYKGESTKKSSINYVFVFYRAMVIFAEKHFSRRNAKAFSHLINAAIYFRAAVALVNRFVKAAIIPALDALLIMLSLVVLKNWYEEYAGLSYTVYWINAALASYTGIWMLGVLFAGGYDKPIKLSKLYSGIAYGTLAILALYALLPESLRFSRAIILMGTGASALVLTVVRLLAHLLSARGYRLGRQEPKRVGIVSGKSEFERIARLLSDSGTSAESIIMILPEKGAENDGVHADQLQEVIEVYRLNLIIFSGQDVSSQQIISCMAAVEKTNIDIKIAPPESLYIIGSNSIERGGELFIMELNAVNKPINRRRKWLFDKVMSCILLLASPVLIWLVQNKTGYFANIISVIAGKKSWVGYAQSNQERRKLPALKPGVLNPLDKITLLNESEDTARKLNAVYAREYSLRNDLGICFSGFRNLGRR
jgi:GT2 family glycosyltransferase